MNLWNFPLKITLATVSSYQDGEPIFARRPARAVMLEEVSRTPGPAAKAENKTVFIVRCSMPACVGSRITWNEQIFEVTGMTVCRTLDGKIFAYRCIVK